MGQIDSYQFGQIEVKGRTYRSDLIIYPDHIDEKWWRKKGHSLEIEDLEGIVKNRPEVLVVGTGQYGVMKIPQQTREYLASLGIELIAENTQKACEIVNRMASQRKVVAALHLTC